MAGDTTGRGARNPAGESGPGATHQRPVPPREDALSDESVHDDESSQPAPRGTDDGRPIDVAPATGPTEMDAAEAGEPTED